MPTTEIRFGERLFVVNLASLMVAGIPVTLEVAMGLACGRKLGKSDLVFSITRSFPRGRKEDQLLERCLVRRGGVVF